MKKINKVLLTIIIILSALIALFYSTYSKNRNNNEDKLITLVVEEYNVYDYSDVDFRFIITKLTIDSKEDVEIQLNELKVNGESLEDSKDYLNELQEYNYRLDEFDDIDDVIIKNDNNDIVTLFIPITDDDFNTATLSSDYFEDIIFDLRENLIVNDEVDEDETEIENDDSVIVEDNNNPPVDNNEFDFIEDQAVVKKGYEIKLETAFSSIDYNYTLNGVNYNSSTNEVLHAIPVRLISKDGANYEVTEAKFVFNSSKKELTAKPASFKTMDLESILNKTTNTKQDGALMFVTYSQSSEPETYKGKLLIRVNNGEWIELEVSI